MALPVFVRFSCSHPYSLLAYLYSLLSPQTSPIPVGPIPRRSYSEHRNFFFCAISPLFPGSISPRGSCDSRNSRLMNREQEADDQLGESDLNPLFPVSVSAKRFTYMCETVSDQIVTSGAFPNSCSSPPLADLGLRQSRRKGWVSLPCTAGYVVAVNIHGIL